MLPPSEFPATIQDLTFNFSSTESTKILYTSALYVFAGLGPVSPKAGKSNRIIFFLLLNKIVKLSQVCSDADVPCISTSGTESDALPSIR